RKPRNQPKTGRPRLYSTPSLLLCRIAADLLGWSLRKTLNHAEQEAGAWLRKALGWEQAPHLSVVCRRLHGDDVRRLRSRLWRKLRRRSLRQGDLRVLTIDMTDLPGTSSGRMCVAGTSCALPTGGARRRGKKCGRRGLIGKRRWSSGKPTWHGGFMASTGR